MPLADHVSHAGHSHWIALAVAIGTPMFVALVFAVVFAFNSRKIPED
jgi:hypothetical protein